MKTNDRLVFLFTLEEKLLSSVIVPDPIFQVLLRNLHFPKDGVRYYDHVQQFFFLCQRKHGAIIRILFLV